MEVVRSLWTPKEGSSDAQYEDAWSVGDSRVAVADGASAAVFARQWAQRLVNDFAQNEPFPDTDAQFWSRIASLGAAWKVEVGGGPAESSAPKPWWAEEKLPDGSAASLLVLSFEAERFRAWAIGDVCLFVVNENKLRWAFPLTRARQFGNHPALVPTDPSRLRERPKVVRITQNHAPNSRFFCMTDALAAWFLSEHEKKRRPWEQLPQTQEAFGPWVTARREDNTLKNDDVTLLEIVL